MFTTVWQQFVLHFGVGVSFAILTVVAFARTKKRRPLFRFGGNDVVTFGSGKLWTLWYVVALSFELGTSFLTHSMYVELALSAFQAVALTVGLFVVDRVSMAFEPESYWMPGYRNLPVQPVVQQLPVQPVPQVLEAKPVNDKSWFSRKVNSAAQAAVTVPVELVRGAVESANAVAAEYKADAAKKDAELKASEVQEKDERAKKLNDQLKGF